MELLLENNSYHYWTFLFREMQNAIWRTYLMKWILRIITKLLSLRLLRYLVDIMQILKKQKIQWNSSTVFNDYLTINLVNPPVVLLPLYFLFLHFILRNSTILILLVFLHFHFPVNLLPPEFLFKMIQVDFSLVRFQISLFEKFLEDLLLNEAYLY